MGGEAEERPHETTAASPRALRVRETPARERRWREAANTLLFDQ